jgi:hypothetical protein
MEDKTQSFEDFLLEKKKSAQDVTFSPEQRKLEWLNSIEYLYQDIKDWMSPFTSKHLMSINEYMVTISEDFIGTYEIKRMDIFIGKNKVSLIPRGTYVFGSYGRIDVVGPKDEILLIQNTWKKWDIVTRTPERQTWSCNQDSFKSILQTLV